MKLPLLVRRIWDKVTNTKTPKQRLVNAAYYNDQWDEVDDLLTLYPELVNTCSFFGNGYCSLLGSAVDKDNLEAAERIIKKGAKVNIGIGGDSRENPLKWVRSPEMADLLFNNGAVVGQFKFKDTVLHYPYSSANVYQKILEKGEAFINVPNNDGETPIFNQTYDITQLLVNKGAKLDVVNNSRQTPITIIQDSDCFFLIASHGGRDVAPEKDIIEEIMENIDRVPTQKSKYNGTVLFEELMRSYKSSIPPREQGFLPDPEKIRQEGNATKREQKINDFAKFCHVMAYAHQLAAAMDPEHLMPEASPLFNSFMSQSKKIEPTLETLRKYSLDQIPQIRDTMNDFVTYALMPHVMHMSLGQVDVNLLGRHSCTRMIDMLIPKAAAYLFSEGGMAKVMTCNHNWHNRREGMIAHIREIPQSGSWHPLIRGKETKLPKQFQGPEKEPLKIVNLTNATELKQEGGDARLKHCVSGYTDRCKNGEIHVFSIQSQDGAKSFATFGLKVEGNNVSFAHEPRGYENAEVSAEIQGAANWLVENINRGTIKVTGKQGEIKNENEVRMPPIIEIIGGIPSKRFNDNAFHQFHDSAVRPGRDACLVPKKYWDTEVAKFMQESGLLEEGMKHLRAMGLKVEPREPMRVTRLLLQDTVNKVREIQRGNEPSR